MHLSHLHSFLALVLCANAAFDLGWKDDTDLTNFVTVGSAPLAQFHA